MDDHPINAILATTRTAIVKSLDCRMPSRDCYPVRRCLTPGIIRAATSERMADSMR